MSEKKQKQKKTGKAPPVGKALRDTVEKFWSNTVKEKLSFVNGKKLLMMNLPYVIVFYLADKVAWLYRHCIGDSLVGNGMLPSYRTMKYKSPIWGYFHVQKE